MCLLIWASHKDSSTGFMSHNHIILKIEQGSPMCNFILQSPVHFDQAVIRHWISETEGLQFGMLNAEIADFYIG